MSLSNLVAADPVQKTGLRVVVMLLPVIWKPRKNGKRVGSRTYLACLAWRRKQSAEQEGRGEIWQFKIEAIIRIDMKGTEPNPDPSLGIR
jgi:hypothetical protein